MATGEVVLDAPRHRPPSRGRAIRSALTVAAIGVLLYGTFAGSDDMFPFGPFHMYSRYYPANGVVTGTTVQAVNANGHQLTVTEADTGLAHGDIEGELREFEADPARLASLANAFHRRQPTASPFVEVRIVQQRWQLADRRIVSKSTVTLVDWHAG